MKKFINLSKEEKLKILTELGGKHWEFKDKERVYFNYWLFEKLLQLEISYYGTGNVSSVCVEGEKWSNCQGKKLIECLKTSKLYYDLVTNEWRTDFRYAPHYYHHYVEKVLDMIEEMAENKVAEVNVDISQGEV